MPGPRSARQTHTASQLARPWQLPHGPPASCNTGTSRRGTSRPIIGRQELADHDRGVAREVGKSCRRTSHTRQGVRTTKINQSLPLRHHSLAMRSNTSAWHGLSNGHQHARWRPLNSARARATIAESTHCSNNATARARSTMVVPVTGSIPPTANGLPHTEGRETRTVFAGIRQPLRRLNCTRSGIAAIGVPESCDHQRD